MSEYFEYIDAYFQNQLNDSERKEFEQRCVDDMAFADDVAFYVSSRAAIKDVLLEQKKAEWAQLPVKEEAEPSTSSEAPVKSINYKRWILYAAAACLILAVISYSLFSTDSPQQLADKYVNNNLASISQTMDASRDSTQLGIAAYNKKDYQLATQLFSDVYNRNPQNTEALRYLGQTHLVVGDYEKAIQSFDELAQTKSYSNPGLFLKAITLMKRNTGTDKEVARNLLQQIADNNLDGSKEAREWLRNWPD